MDSIENSGFTANTANPPQSKGTAVKILLGILLGFSIIANVFLLMVLGATVILFAAGKNENYIEKVLEHGPAANKIAVIRIEGLIDNKLADSVISQIKAAKNDKNVKALILKTSSPGGSVSASDRIYNEVCEYRANTGRPAVAFMQTLAASGGYYTSCGCDKIIAEPTVITGSIGVIMGHFMLKDLFEMKLGIMPVIIKSGPHKDWPTSFEPVTEEQVLYINNKLIMPAYERFVGIVAKSRKGLLTIEQVKALADGSIYNSEEAVQNKLIDQTGYMEDAIKLAKSLASISDAKIVEYEKPFSVEDFLESKSIIKIDRSSLYELASPQLMYLWDAGLVK